MNHTLHGLSWISPPSPRSRSESQVELIVRSHTPPITTHDEQPVIIHDTTKSDDRLPHSLTRHRYLARAGTLSSIPDEQERIEEEHVHIDEGLYHYWHSFCSSLETTTGATHVLWCFPHIWRIFCVPCGRWIALINKRTWVPWCYHMFQYSGLFLIAESFYERKERNGETDHAEIIQSRVNDVWWWGIMMLLYTNHSSIQLVRLPLIYSCIGGIWLWILSCMDKIPGFSSIVLSESTSERVKGDTTQQAYFIIGTSVICSLGYVFPLLYQCVYQNSGNTEQYESKCWKMAQIQLLIWVYFIYIAIEKMIYSSYGEINEAVTLHVHHWFVGWCLLWTHQWDSSIIIRILHVLSFYTFLHGAVVYQFDPILEYHAESTKN